MVNAVYFKGGKGKMTKKTRELVYAKYNGRCAYCGHEITLKEMQVDHIIPRRLGGADSLDNYNPSCRICNHYKRAEKLEPWRNFFLGGLLKRIKNIYIVKVAERYGMITFHEWDKKFYFEREIKEND
jgi:CRISPR/Cas system Type II protein with McrA/HNH and RuvC-like nuclease domain